MLKVFGEFILFPQNVAYALYSGVNKSDYLLIFFGKDRKMITKCKECGAEMSTNARECPKCGRYRHFMVFSELLALVVWLALLAWLFYCKMRLGW